MGNKENEREELIKLTMIAACNNKEIASTLFRLTTCKSKAQEDYLVELLRQQLRDFILENAKGEDNVT